ncbi:MAG TPA: DnaB-like helicase N-terminal domain-containing protein, partial [Chitinophagales bacterium]
MAEPAENISRQTAFQPRRKTTLSADAAFVDYGKLPPQAKDLEEAVLGALMLESDAIDTVAEILKPESFYVEAHQVVYRAVRELYQSNSPIDMLTVVARLRQNGDLEKVGGPYYIAQLTNKVASAANIEYHARIVAQKYIQRMLISSSTEVIRDAYEDTTDVFELLDKAETNIMNISENNIKKSSEDIATIITKELKELDVRIHSDEHLNGVSSGFRE